MMNCCHTGCIFLVFREDRNLGLFSGGDRIYFASPLDCLHFATLPLPWPCPGLIRTKKKDGTLEGWEKDGTLVVSVEVIGSGGPRLL